MKGRILGLFSIFLIIWLLVWGCEKKAPEKKAVKATAPRGAVIYLDTSISMRGYFRTTQNQGTTLQRFMWQHLIQILDEPCLNPVYLSTFGNEIAMPQRITSLDSYALFDSQHDLDGIFSATETRLIDLFEKDFDSSRQAFLIITDGIPSTPEHTGPDPEIIRAVEQKGKKGVHLWLIGLYSEFDGTIYPECRDSHGLKVPFHFSGRRPVYIWIGTREIEKGKEIAARIYNELEALGAQANIAELTSLDVPRCSIIPDTKGLADILIIPVAKNKFELHLSRTTKNSLVVPLRIECQETEIHRDWRYRLEIRPTSLRWVRVVSDEKNQWRLLIFSRRIPGPGILMGCSSQGVSFDLRLNAIPVKERWWADWSTDDDSSPSNGSKTLYLKELISNFVNKFLDKQYPVAIVSITKK